MAVFLAMGFLGLSAHAGGTVTFSLSSPSAGGIVAPGELVEWTISLTVSAGDNLGLALAAVDLVQDPANPALFDLPVGTCPTGMEDFDRPGGISNPGPGGVGSAYGGTPLGPAGAKNLRQIGGAMNTFAVPGDGIGLDYDVRGGVGQGAPQILAAGSFAAPSTLGLYAFHLENAIANTLDEINSPPDFSPVSAGNVSIVNADISFTVAPAVCVGDLNCDGQIDFHDINPFVQYLSKFDLWQTQYPGCNPLNGDINGDGIYGFGSFKDINPFVTLLCSAPLPIPCD
jgi:hypothetical protein